MSRRHKKANGEVVSHAETVQFNSRASVVLLIFGSSRMSAEQASRQPYIINYQKRTPADAVQSLLSLLLFAQHMPKQENPQRSNPRLLRNPKCATAMLTSAASLPQAEAPVGVLTHIHAITIIQQMRSYNTHCTTPVLGQNCLLTRLADNPIA
jgi:hypothetical protein